MTNKIPSGTRNDCESTEPESHQTPKHYFLLSFFLSFFRQASSKLYESLKLVLHNRGAATEAEAIREQQLKDEQQLK